MTIHYRLYLQIIDALRTRRSHADWEAEQDRDELERLEELFEKLSPDEKRRANREGWRSWPDLYDQHMESALLESLTLDADDAAPVRHAA